MRRTKLITSLTTVAAMGLLLIFFSSSVLAIATTRPISDFTDTNNNIAAWADPESGLTIFPHGWYVFGFPDALESIADCNPSGSVLEKDLKDGRIMYQVNLHVKGATMVIASDVILVIGEMDYIFQVTIILYDGELGDPVPNLLEIWFPEAFPWGDPLIDPIGEGTFSHITGKGTGTFLDPNMALYYGFDPDEEVKVKVNEVGLLDKDFEDGHPNYYPDLEQFWPVEIVFFH
ncbi:MAG: hypothetical protein ACFFFB_11550 [Candidatus Heimdallarchaeota archaeon]